MYRDIGNLRLREIRKFLTVYTGPFSVFLATALVLYQRLNFRGKNLFQESLWAEDGLFALCNIKSSAFRCGFDSYSGYWSGSPRLIAWIVSRFPMHEWASVNNSLTLILYSTMAAFAYSCVSGQIENKIFSIFVTLAPSVLSLLSFEVLMVENSFFEILNYFTLLIFLYGSRSIQESSWPRWVFYSLIFICMVSNPLGAILCIVFWVDFFFHSSRAKYSFKISMVAFFGTLIEAIYVFMNHSNRNLGIGLPDFIEFSLVHLAKSFSLIFFVPPDLNYDSAFKSGYFATAILLCALTLLVSLVLVVGLRERFRAFFMDRRVFYPIFALVTTIFISVFTRGIERRFGVLTTLYATLIIIGILQSRPRVVQNCGYIILVSAYIVNGILNFGAGDFRSAGPLWNQELKLKKEYCLANPSSSIRLVFAPNWSATFSHPYRVSEPTTEKIDCTDFNNAE